MMKLTVPKRTGNLYYVSSESKPEERNHSHIVVRHAGLFFCDCRDFMIRKLPMLGTTEFRLCKHGEFVRDVVGTLEADEQLILAVRQGVPRG
jgi:hypothetical protein